MYYFFVKLSNFLSNLLAFCHFLLHITRKTLHLFDKCIILCIIIHFPSVAFVHNLSFLWYFLFFLSLFPFSFVSCPMFQFVVLILYFTNHSFNKQ